MRLAPIWEVWNWSDGTWTFLGVVLLLYAAFAGGFAQGRHPGGEFNKYPSWVQWAMLAAILGVVFVIAGNAPPCELGECEPPGP
jgi:hypothetical protein